MLKCLDAPIALQDEYPIISTEAGDRNHDLLEEVLSSSVVEVLRTTLYVEDSRERIVDSLLWALCIA